jgi:hypothetical protein
MEAPRWLLPFTFGVDMRAIDYAVSLAESAGATLVPVALVSTPSKGARLEHIQQSKDFLETVQHKAARYQVPVERYEVFTQNMLQSIRTLVTELPCHSIILVTGGEQSRLMQDEEVKRLLVEPPAPLVLIRLPGQSGYKSEPHLWARFVSWLRGLRGLQEQQQSTWQVEDTQAVEEPLWIRTEQPHAR